MRKIIFIFIALIALASSAGAAPTVRQRFNLSFSPPLIYVSRFNSKGELLAVQLSAKGDQPARIIAVSRRGGLRLVEDLTAKKTLTVPGPRLWIAQSEQKTGRPEVGPHETGLPVEASLPAAHSKELPVIRRQVWLAKSGECYAVAYFASGGWYELRYMDKDGKLLFIAAPKDDYGLASVIVSDNGSRVLIDDETQPYSMTKPGQRLYLYDRNGKLLMDRDAGENLDGWLDAQDGFMAADGSCFAAPMGMGKRQCYSIVLLDENGKQIWDKSYFPRHIIEGCLGGLFLVRGGNLSFINLLDRQGNLKTVERKGYGFELMLSKDAKKAYMMMFKPFDVKTSGLPGQIRAVFPKAEVIAVNLPELVSRPAPESDPVPTGRPASDVKVALSPDGKSFICYSSRAAMGMQETVFRLFEEDQTLLWKKYFFQAGIVPNFTGSREFLLKFGYPIRRLAFFSPKAGA